MRKLLIAFVILSLNGFSQTEEKINLYAKSYPDSMLIHRQTGDTIHGFEIKFNQMIKSVAYDSATNNLLTYLTLISGNSRAGKDHFVAAYSLNKDTFLWKKNFNPQKKTYHYFDNQLILNGKNGADFLSLDSHKLIKNISGEIFLDKRINNKGIGLGFNKYDNFNSKLFGYNVKTGKIIWEDSSNSYPKEYLNKGILVDSHYIFFTESMYGINIYNGENWKYNYDFYKYVNPNNDYSYMIGGLLGYILYNMIVENMESNSHNTTVEQHYPVQSENQSFNFRNENFNQHCSNLIIKKNKLSIAINKSLLTMNLNGENVKKVDFPNYLKTCQSNLFEINDKYYLINKGYYEYGRNVCSDPFIIKYSGDTIEKIRVFSDEKVYDKSVEDFDENYVDISEHISYISKIIGFQIDNNKIILLFDKAISILDFELKLKANKFFKSKDCKDWSSLIHDETFIAVNDSSFIILPRDTVINVLNNNNSINQYNYKLELKNSYNSNQIYKPIYKDSDLTFVEDLYHYNTIVLNSNNQKILNLVNVKSVEFKNNKYIIGLGDIVYIVDKKEFVR